MVIITKFVTELEKNKYTNYWSARYCNVIVGLVSDVSREGYQDRGPTLENKGAGEEGCRVPGNTIICDSESLCDALCNKFRFPLDPFFSSIFFSFSLPPPAPRPPLSPVITYQTGTTCAGSKTHDR